MNRRLGVAGIVMAGLLAFGCASGELMDAIGAAQETQVQLAANLEAVRAKVEADDAANKTQLLEVLDNTAAITASTSRFLDPIAEAIESQGVDNLGPLLTAAGVGAGQLPVPFAPMIALGLTTIGGFLESMRQRKKARLARGEVDGLATVLVRASKIGGGTITPNDPAHAAVLDAMGPAAKAAIDKAQGA